MTGARAIRIAVVQHVGSLKEALMRWTLSLLALPITSALAAEPPRLCAVPDPVPLETADHSTPMQAPTPAATRIKTAPTPSKACPGIPTTLTAIPFVEHVASAGATLTDLGVSHGMRVVAASSGDQFMLFDVAPDGQVAISGAPIDLSIAQLQSIAAGNITELGKQHGLRGFFVRSGPAFQVFYASPDGERLIPGVMWDASGKDLTRQQVSHVPGAIPTVEVGASGSSQVAPGAALNLVNKATFGTIGPASAPRLYMLIDPQCIYSMRAFQMLRPYAEAGRVQIAVIPLSVLDYEDRGQSTRSALALLSDPPDQIVGAWQSGNESNPISAEAPQKLRNNMVIAEAIGLRGTPTFIWREPDGTEGRLNGLPGDVQALVASVGS
ncbi:MAG: hypothetical protein JO122_08205 [Acetobacteraceae bacterium]|nr:hypothetical protein [Acetobacteraceae bacterium]